MNLGAATGRLRRWVQERLGPGVRRLRRAVAKAIAPALPEPDPQIDIFIDLTLKGAEALRKQLPFSEKDYMVGPGYVWADGKAYLLYTALDEAQKAAMHLLHLRETLDGPPVSPTEDRLSRLVVSQILEEQISRHRRLLELLVMLVLFSTTDEPEYYRDILLLEHLDDLLSANADFKEFYGARSANVDYSINDRASEIRRLEAGLDLSRS